MLPFITGLLAKIQYDTEWGIKLYPPASATEVADFEHAMNMQLPSDMRTFYSFCNGFESEDLFRIIPLNEIVGNESEKPSPYVTGENDFYIAEYLIYSDMWTISIDKKDAESYAIYNIDGYLERATVLTNHFASFLDKFLIGGIKGLYDWQEQLRRGQY